MTSLKITSWNINSVRLRINQVVRALDDINPDILCLQETKCPNDCFPLKDIKAAGYPYIAIHGQKGYHGVAIASRVPFRILDALEFGGKPDARHISIQIEQGPCKGFEVHNFYVPAGGDVPDIGLNNKFAHKLDFLHDVHVWGEATTKTANPRILVGDLNVAPLEHDVWSHKQLLDVVSHTPVETQKLETLRQAGRWLDVARLLYPEPEKLYSWWSYRSPDWAMANKGRRLDHIWLSDDLETALQGFDIFKEARGWERPSDHVPISVTLKI